MLEVVPEVRSPEWYRRHVFKFSIPKVQNIAEESTHKLTFLLSQTFYDDEVWHLFDKTIFLTIDSATLAHRLATRGGTTYGKSPDELAYILGRHAELQQLHIRHNALLVKANQPLDQVVNDVLRAAL